MMRRRDFARVMGLSLAAACGGRIYGRGFAPALGGFAFDETLDFGRLEPLASAMQDLEADQAVARCVELLRAGTSANDLAAAAALANARTFGGEDYVGFHCMMAILPALEMAPKMGAGVAALPLLKVIHRNTKRIREVGGRKSEKMRRLPATEKAADAGAALLAAERSADQARSQMIFAAEVRADPVAAFALLEPVIRDNLDVHQVVLAWRSFDLMRISGADYADTLLVQALRSCVDRERDRQARKLALPESRAAVDAAAASYGAVKAIEGRAAPIGDEQLDAAARRFMTASKAESLTAVGTMLGKGYGFAAVHSALCLAAVRLLLHDPGHKVAQNGLRVGAVHGASIGVHAADSANAWRHIALALPGQAATIAAGAAWHTAGQASAMNVEAPAHESARGDVEKLAPERLIDELDRAVAEGEHLRAAALAERAGKVGLDADLVVRRLASVMVADDGRLHHEKFFHTAVEEFGRTPNAFRWEWITALARVAASGAGSPAAGVEAAREHLAKV